jgi:hypothetical protein
MRGMRLELGTLFKPRNRIIHGFKVLPLNFLLLTFYFSSRAALLLWQVRFRVECRVALAFFYKILRATSYELQATSYKLRATSYELQATSYKLRATSYELQAISYKLL